jgi:transcriptional regulator with XRE-family HTH domain
MMNFGDYLKGLRNENGLSQRDLAEKSGVSNAEISRLETGDRKKPSPIVLKALYPYLGVSYEELMQKAGYSEEVVDHPGYTERYYRDENGVLIDVVKQINHMYDKNSNWASLAYRVTSSDLTDDEIKIIESQTKALFEQFLKNKKK